MTSTDTKPRLPWSDHEEYRAMHGVVTGRVTAFANAAPDRGQCPRGRQWCDTSRTRCRSFGGVDNLDEAVNGKPARILCREAPDADERLTEWAKAQDDR